MAGKKVYQKRSQREIDRRGIKIAKSKGQVNQICSKHWEVASQSDRNKIYEVTTLKDEKFGCECQYYIKGDMRRCKHIAAVEFVIKRDSDAGITASDGEEKKAGETEKSCKRCKSKPDKGKDESSSLDTTDTDTDKSPQSKTHRRKYDDRKYIERGKLWTLQISPELMTEGIEDLNAGKKGRPFRFSNKCFAAASVFKNMTGIPYRQLTGVAETIIGKDNTPVYSAFQKRIVKLNLAFKDNDDGSGVKTACAWFTDGKTKSKIDLFAFDSSGLKYTNSGDWMSKKWGTKRSFIKFHIGVDSRTKKIYGVVITDEKSGDSPQLEKLIEQTYRNAEKSPNVETTKDTKVAADGAYDSNENYEYCEEQNIEPLIPVRINFSENADGSVSRKKAGFKQLGGVDSINKNAERRFAELTRDEKLENQKVWRKKSGFSDRWSVETAFSTFKRMFGELVSARTWDNIIGELYGKVQLYNMMIDGAIDSGYGTPEVVEVKKPRRKGGGGR